MNDLQILVDYRINQAKTTLADARIMLEQGGSPRSIVNRAYYAAFYSALALFLKAKLTLKTSKHSGVIGQFDKNFVIAGKIEKKYSLVFHNLFEDRQEFDYKEFAQVNREDGKSAVEKAEEFIAFIADYIEKMPQ